MNLNLPFVPERMPKPRTKGVNMIMDKGLTPGMVEQTIETSGHLIDFAKLGFGTAAFTNLNALKKKVKLYHKADIRVYLGGTLFEACLLRGKLNEYYCFAEDLKLECAEVSDGSMLIDHDEKCRLIREMKKKFEVVLSEVGSKVAGKVLSADQWIEMMQKELDAGSSYVIAEARESGNVGIFNPDGSANQELIAKISEKIPLDRIMWEAPMKAQQAWFIRHFGPEVNLGNVSHNETIALETLRTGLRGDTFGLFVPDELKAKVQR